MQLSFKIDNDPRSSVFLEVIGHIMPMSQGQIGSLAKQAGCSPRTLLNWRSARVFSPQLNKLVGVATALGYELKLNKKRTKLYAIEK